MEENVLNSPAKIAATDRFNAFERRIRNEWGSDLSAVSAATLQVNVGLRCNQQCAHCHVAAAPTRKEEMSWDVMQSVIEVARKHDFSLIDITGGAPELHPRLREFIVALRENNCNVQVRTNLTVLTLAGQETTGRFFRDHDVQLVASLPCYLENNVDAQRGEGVYRESIVAMRQLNELGYGVDDNLRLNLVYNPGGDALPPDQANLEQTYRDELEARWGIQFSQLLTITNMDIGRFKTQLGGRAKRDSYQESLEAAFNPSTVAGLMCRHQIEVGWDGRLYDCDFNLALRLPVDHGSPNHIDQFDMRALKTRRIVTADHCFGCTAGCGSSCAGALA